MCAILTICEGNSRWLTPHKRPVIRKVFHNVKMATPKIAKFMGPTWGPPGSCRPQMDPMLAPWTLLSGTVFSYAAIQALGEPDVYPTHDDHKLSWASEETEGHEYIAVSQIYRIDNKTYTLTCALSLLLLYNHFYVNLCCAFTHIFQSVFTDTGEIASLTKCR